jgi:hypothetical protein
VSAKQNGLVHRYDRLEPHERFRAALEATARGDEEEHDRLWDTCPMRHYSMTDAAFTDRWRASGYLAMAVAIDLGPRLANLRMLAAVRETLPKMMALDVDGVAAGEDGLKLGWLPGDDGLNPAEVREVVDETLGWLFRETEDHIRSEAAAVYGAFSGLCRTEIGLEPELVLRAFLGPLHHEALGLEELDGAEPDQEALSMWSEMFARKWAERVGG